MRSESLSEGNGCTAAVPRVHFYLNDCSDDGTDTSY